MQLKRSLHGALQKVFWWNFLAHGMYKKNWCHLGSHHLIILPKMCKNLSNLVNTFLQDMWSLQHTLICLIFRAVFQNSTSFCLSSRGFHVWIKVWCYSRVFPVRRPDERRWKPRMIWPLLSVVSQYHTAAVRSKISKQKMIMKLCSIQDKLDWMQSNKFLSFLLWFLHLFALSGTFYSEHRNIMCELSPFTTDISHTLPVLPHRSAHVHLDG